jgi:hypothetical protein
MEMKKIWSESRKCIYVIQFKREPEMIQKNRKRGYRGKKKIKVKSNFQFSKMTYSQIALWHATPKQKDWDDFLDEQYGEESDTKAGREEAVLSHQHQDGPFTVIGGVGQRPDGWAGLDLKETSPYRRQWSTPGLHE